MVVLAFLVPLALLVQHLAREQSLAEAERQTAIVVAVLAVTTDPAAVDRAIQASANDRADRVAVHRLSTGAVGVRHARDRDVTATAELGQPAVVSVPGGVSYLEPVDIGYPSPAVVEVFVPQAELSQGVRSAWLALAIVAAILLVVSVLTSDRLAAKVVASARRLAGAARALGDGDLDVRVAPSGPRELAEAGVAFNTMADRVAALLSAERELIADLSHRLRTPLTALRLEAERFVDGPPDERSPHRLRHAVDAMEREVDTLIHTARRPDQPPPPPAPAEPTCDAGEVVRERMAFWAAVADDQSRPYQVLGTDRRAPVPLSRADLAAALDALLGNVFRYTPQGTPFEVSVARRDGYVAVRVDDAGPGIADPDHALRRGVSARGSTGLGLDIVRQVAVAGHGSVDVDRADLGGASVVVLLADAEAPAANRHRLGFVGRLSREPGERRRRRRSQ
ncbi:MAG: sensor histidine kinase [Micromonosporaceae bacterium]